MNNNVGGKGFSYPKFNVKYSVTFGEETFEKELYLSGKSVDSVKEYVYIEETQSARMDGFCGKIEFIKIEEI